MSGRSRWLCGCAALLLVMAHAQLARAAPAPWLARAASEEGSLRSESEAEAGGAQDAAAEENKYYELQYNTLDYAMSDVTQRGSAYLEGLRRSLERLTRPERDPADPAACDPAAPSPANLTATPPSAAANLTAATNSTDRDDDSATRGVERCEERRRATVAARGTAALALHTTRLLARPDLPPRREAELVARLAALLHSLAGTLGYRYTPDPADNTTAAAAPGEPASSSSAPAVPPHFMNASGEQVRQMILCLDPLASANDSRPSYERCPPLPPAPPAAATSGDGAGVAEQQTEAGSRRRRRAAPQLLRVESDSGEPQQREGGGVRAETRSRARNQLDAGSRPEDPHQDISYVSKLQPGRTITNDQVGAAQTRAQLAAHFLSPDIERTRRFGSNYRANNVFISGGLRILSDV